MSDIVSFLIKLAADPRETERFLADPRAALEKAGLSDRERRAILSGDRERIRRVLGDACTFPSNIYGTNYGPNIYIMKDTVKSSKEPKTSKRVTARAMKRGGAAARKRKGRR